MVTPVVREIYPPRPGIAWFVPPAPAKQPPPSANTPPLPR
jgi:hypothetical protein